MFAFMMVNFVKYYYIIIMISIYLLYNVVWITVQYNIGVKIILSNNSLWLTSVVSMRWSIGWAYFSKEST